MAQLAAAGAKLHYHGDFDWAGLHIANVLMREFVVVPWRFRAVDYLAAIETMAGRRHPLTGTAVVADWDVTLTELMREQQIAIAEEALTDLVIGDLEA